MEPRNPSAVTHLFLPADLGTGAPHDLWSATTADLPEPVGAWATDPPAVRRPEDRTDSGTALLAVRQKTVPGRLHEAALYRMHDVVVISRLNSSPHSWTVPGTGPRASTIGSAVIVSGVRPRRELDHGRPPIQTSGDWSRTADGVTWWNLPETDGHERRILARAGREPALTRLLWTSDGREIPPMTRYLVHAARLRNQQELLREGLPGPRRAADRTQLSADARAGILREPDPPVPRLRAARDGIQLAQAEQGGLITAIADARDLAGTLQAITRNLGTALGTTREGEPDGPAATDQDLARRAAEQVRVELTYLESARLRAGELTRLADAVVGQAETRRQQALTVWQTAVLGGLVMALTAVQSFDYSPPLPASLFAPLIAVLAGVAVLLPLRVTRTFRSWFWVAVLGAAVGWLGATGIHRFAEGRPAPAVVSVLAAVGGAGIFVIAERWVKPVTGRHFS